jgi:hypothetical protein
MADRLRERLIARLLRDGLAEAEAGYGHATAEEVADVVLDELAQSEAQIKADGVREAAAEWSEWEVFTAADGHRAIRQHDMEPDEWLRAWADRKVNG